MNRSCFQRWQSYGSIFLILEKESRCDASGSEVAHGNALVESDVPFLLLQLTQSTFRPVDLNYHQTLVDVRFRCACVSNDAPWREAISSGHIRREGVGNGESAGPCARGALAISST